MDHDLQLSTDCLTAKLLLTLASTVNLRSESHGYHAHILLSDSSGCLQVATLTWCLSVDSAGALVIMPFTCLCNTDAQKVWGYAVPFQKRFLVPPHVVDMLVQVKHEHREVYHVHAMY